MPVTTRSSFRKPSSNTATMLDKINRIIYNAKGYPTVGHLTPRPLKRQPKVNGYLEKCISSRNNCQNIL